MKEISFQLIPFAADTRLSLSTLSVTGRIRRQANRIGIEYILFDPQALVSLPSQVKVPKRQDGLWQETCFELFLAHKNSPAYREFNLSPAGLWNVYRFDSYRQGMREEPGFTSLPFSIQKNSESFSVTLEFDIGKMEIADRDLAVAISVVLKTGKESITYWALSHQGEKPDFHRRDCFVIKL